MADGDEARWWWSLKSNRAEQGAGDPNAERLGPFDTEAEAAGALDRAKQRNQSWESDPRWNDDN